MLMRLGSKNFFDKIACMTAIVSGSNLVKELYSLYTLCPKKKFTPRFLGYTNT